MRKTKKQNQTEKLQQAERKIHGVLEALDFEDILSFVVGEIEWDIGYAEDDIQNEIDYAKYETDSYAGQKAESRRVVKAMKKTESETKACTKTG